MSVRVRYAPSPTGFNHSGGIRTALYNYLFAKRHNGTFILRIEDTDQKRFVPAAEKYIKDSLDWLGITPDESPWNPNPRYGNYRQSERNDIYKGYIDALIDSGHAYYAFDTDEELKVITGGEGFGFFERHKSKNSIVLPAEEIQRLLAEGTPYVVRFMVPHNVDVVVHDELRGDIKFNSGQIDDKILIKSDGIPTYHFASVVDDHLMDISHVLRGDEWLASFPFHKLLYDAFGWEMPIFAHMPVVLNPDGKGKLSKRTAAAKGFEIFPLEVDTVDEKDKPVHFDGYKKLGYEATAYANFIALLGHSFSKDTLTMQEMVDEFDLAKVHTSPAIFDTNKLAHINKFHLGLADPIKLWHKSMNVEQSLGIHRHIITNIRPVIIGIMDSIMPRLKTRLDIPEFAWPFLNHEKTMDISDETKEHLRKLIADTPKIDPLGGPWITVESFNRWVAETHINKKELREVVCSSRSGSDIATVQSVIGLEEFYRRAEKYL